jgi:hypothetical protein
MVQKKRKRPRRATAGAVCWYTFRRLPAPQISFGLPAQAIEQSVAAAFVLTAASEFAQ